MTIQRHRQKLKAEDKKAKVEADHNRRVTLAGMSPKRRARAERALTAKGAKR